MRLAALVKAGERRDKHRVAVEVDGRELVLSNLDKILYPADGFTKGDVIDYPSDRVDYADPSGRPARHP